MCYRGCRSQEKPFSRRCPGGSEALAIIGWEAGIPTGLPKLLSINWFGQRLLNWPVELQTHFASPCIPARSPRRYPLRSLRLGWRFILPRLRHDICSLSSINSRQTPTAVFSTGVASQCLGDHMAGMRRKADLPTKACVVCGRPFVWRKKWERDWSNVKYCSERCRAATARRAGQHRQLHNGGPTRRCATSPEPQLPAAKKQS